MTSMLSLSNAAAAVPGAVASVVLENAGAGVLGAGVATFGQVFAQGELPAGGRLTAQIGGVAVALQVDVKTTHEDGSAKMAVLSVARPALAAGASAELVLARPAAGAAPPAAGPALDLATALGGHSFTVDLAIAGRAAPVAVDVLAAVKSALAAGTASVWQKGELAAQARVEVLVPNSSMRLVFDVTAYKGGGLEVDAQFNNDRAMEAVGGGLTYDLTARMNGAVVARETVTQAQYQNWHRDFSSTGADGGQGTGAPSQGWLNVVHDAGRLGKIGAVADYDLTLQVPEQVLAGYGAATAAPGWGGALAVNGVTQYMPMVGGRPDIGFTTASNTAWLLSGDARAAAYSLGQAEASGAVPWNFWDDRNDTWLNTANYPRLWTDGRGGTGRPGDAASGGLTQQVSFNTGWTPDRAHQPDLSFVPYVLTGERWMLDNLNAQAAFNIMSLWPSPRGDGAALVVQDLQTRGAAWAMRQIENAAWASPDGSAERAYFRSVADANWKWLASQIPAWTAQQGEVHGWIPTSYDNSGVAPWQQDFFASTAILAASRGSADAMTVLQWQANFLVGRFQHAADGFNPHDGIAYYLPMLDPATGGWVKTWAALGALTSARGLSNGDGWEKSQGYYGQLGLATLAGLYQLTGSADALKAYHALVADAPPNTTAGAFAGMPNFAVALPGVYAGTVVGTGGDDDIALKAASATLDVDLGGGQDRLTLADGGNAGTFENVEVLVGGSGRDVVALTPAAGGTTVDLRGGDDRLTLADAGGRVTAANVEAVVGGAGNDAVALTTPAQNVWVDLGGGNDLLGLGAAVQGGSVDLGAGLDRLVLSSAGPNRLTVANAETVRGAAAADDVALGTAMLGGVVDLNAGADRLTLFSGAANRLTVRDVETIVGGWEGDEVTLGAPLRDGAVDLGSGGDRLALSSAGPNRLTVANVETVLGGAAGDDVTLGGPVSGTLVDLGAGADRLALAPGGGLLTVVNAETVLGAAGNDDLTLGAAVQGAWVDLGAGADRLTLAGAGPNRLLVAGVETLRGGGGADDVTLGAAVQGASVDLGGGLDRLTLSSAGPNRLTAVGAETILGGTAADDVTLDAPVQGGWANLGAGADRLILSGSGPNRVTVLNAETVQGSWAAADDVTLGAPVQGGVVDLANGDDRLALSSAGPNRLTVTNVETIVGGGASDDVALGSGLWYGSVDLGGGQDRLTLADGWNALALAGVETVVGGAGNDRVTIAGAAAAHVSGGGEGDVIVGGAGNDTIIGGADGDQLAGGAGADRFVFTAVADSTTDVRDHVADFAPGADLLAFSGLLKGGFAYRGAGPLLATGNSQAGFNDEAKLLQVDVNGDGTADMGIHLWGVSGASLSAASFAWA